MTGLGIEAFLIYAHQNTINKYFKQMTMEEEIKA